jgi:type II secretory pathway component GspD/PulD (secretin)
LPSHDPPRRTPKNSTRTRLLVFVLGLVVSTAGALSAAPRLARDAGASLACKKVAPGKRVVQLRLRPESALADVVGLVSGLTCRNFAYAPKLLDGKTVNVVSHDPMTVEEVERLFEELLAMHGLRLEPGAPEIIVARR